MENLKAFEMGANVITLYKDKQFYGMTCAWAMMTGYDRLLMLLGSQSDTAKHLAVGDKVGVSALSKGQVFIANHFGDNHSLAFPKYNQHYLTKLNDCYVVKEAKVQMVCEVIDIMHLKGIEEDNLVYLKVINYETSKDKEFLSYKELE